MYILSRRSFFFKEKPAAAFLLMNIDIEKQQYIIFQWKYDRRMLSCIL